MADDRGPYQSHGRRSAEDIRRQYQERMKAYHGWVHGAAATPLLMSRLSEHINDAFTLVQQVSQARNLKDVFKLQTAFVRKKIDMLSGGAKALTDVVANAGAVVGSFTSVSQYGALVDNIARNSPRYEEGVREKDGARIWRAKADDRRT